ncbi:MAG TPA: POTRA domain-containing protein [Pyrinomonadaceae bacterium]
MPHCKSRSKIIGLLFIALLTFPFISTAAAQQPSKLIETIDFQGNRRLTDEEILGHIKTRPGDRFNEKQMQEDLQSLLKLGLFSSPQTRVITEQGIRGGVYVIFEIMELPLIVEVKFEGLKYVTKEELLAELHEQSAQVAANSPYEPLRLRKARDIIIKYLAKKRSFGDAKVEITTEEVSATALKISFGIDEMPNDDEPEDWRKN